jgi:hypothetical protein
MKASTSLFVGARAPLLEAAGFRTVRPVWASLLICGDTGHLPRRGCPAGEGFACCDDFGRALIGSGGVGLARRLGESIPRSPSARLRQTVDDSVVCRRLEAGHRTFNRPHRTLPGWDWRSGRQ